MSALMGPIILLGILIVFFIVFLIVVSRQNKKHSINDVKKNGNNSDKNKKSKNGKDTEELKKEDVFDFMEFDKILDNMIVQENGTKFTMAIKCKGINYDLMSEVEKLSVEDGFITFLNTLRFPIQLYVQAQNIDLKKNVKMYNEKISNLKDEYEESAIKYNKVLDDLEATREEIQNSERDKKSVQNVLEYATDIIRYVEKLSLNKNLLLRNFYIIFSYHTSEITSGDKFTKEEIIDICFNELYTRAMGMISGLLACSVNSNLLDSNELAQLLYTSYDRDGSNMINLKQALDSGYYRLYSTSNDTFQKRQQILDVKIREEAEIKAYEAIKKAIKEGSYLPQEIEEVQIEEEISKRAIEVVKEQDLDYDLKEEASKIIIDQYRENKAEKMGILREKVDPNYKSKIKDNITKEEDTTKAVSETNKNNEINKKNEINKNDEINENDEISLIKEKQEEIKKQEITPQIKIVEPEVEKVKKEVKKEIKEEVKKEIKQEEIKKPEIKKQEENIFDKVLKKNTPDSTSSFGESGLRSASRNFDVDENFESYDKEISNQDIEKNVQKELKVDEDDSEDDGDELII
jgi:hypothetical protein